jgi:hypothetical protein
VLDASAARDIWDWQPARTTEDILDEILGHAVGNPDWLEVSCRE